MADSAPSCDDPKKSLFTCWCGVTGVFEDMFDDEVYGETCGGNGVIYCYCGGDFCVCHHHGDYECDGCEDCESEDWDDFNSDIDDEQ